MQRNNKATTPTSIRISYINTKIETYIPNPLRGQKCGHPRDKCTRPPISTKCGKIKSHRIRISKSL